MEIDRWATRQVFKVSHRTYRGQECNSRLHIAIAYAGEIQIELIESISRQKIYTEFLEGKGEGLHHLGFLIDDYEQAVRDFTANGYPVIQIGRVCRDRGTRFAYFYTEAAIGSIMEIIAPDEAGQQLFDRIKRGDF
ncbi:MAG: VOC family protein [Pseudomonadota bacterium]